MLILSAEDVASLLDLDRLIDSLEVAMTDLSAGRLSMPPRTAAYVAERHGLLGVMPAHLPAAKALVCKLVSVFPENRDVASHQALICCFDSSNGTPVAVMDGTHVTAVRTAAGSALATRLLARADARVVTVIGAGVQAAAHSLALSRLPGVELILLAGRDRHRVRTLAAQLAADGVNATASDTIESAVRAADVICAATHAAEPVLSRAWLRPGTHVNSVGYNVTGAGEMTRTPSTTLSSSSSHERWRSLRHPQVRLSSAPRWRPARCGPRTLPKSGRSPPARVEAGPMSRS